MQFVTVKLVVEGFQTDSKNLRGTRFIVLTMFQRLNDELAFGIFYR
jgi:hypothetical protein